MSLTILTLLKSDCFKTSFTPKHFITLCYHLLYLCQTVISETKMSYGIREQIQYFLCEWTTKELLLK